MIFDWNFKFHIMYWKPQYLFAIVPIVEYNKR